MERQQKFGKNRKGRESQKNRTRMALIEAAKKLMAAGGSPTVSEVADAAAISRATAYRYFPTQEMLLAEVALFAVGGPLVAGDDRAVSVPDAVAGLVQRVGRWSLASEQPLRTLLRLSLDPATGVRRPGHRVKWIADVLEPIRGRIAPATFEKLSRALALYLGIDPIVVMKDIVGASDEEALQTIEWSARALVEAAIASDRGRRKTQ
jgi:AcrR family transcriptional regulator